MKSPMLRTKRLLLRRWTDEDRDLFAQISADPEVMRYRPAPLSHRESDDLIDETEANFDKNASGYGLSRGSTMVGCSDSPASESLISTPPSAQR